MEKLTTFEDIFNKLNQEYCGLEVRVETKQDNLKITSFYTTIDNISIKPLNKKQSLKWNPSGKKIGLMIFSEKNRQVSFNIPFLLGFDTMKAVFLKNGVTIKTLALEFVIQKEKQKQKRLA